MHARVVTGGDDLGVWQGQDVKRLIAVGPVETNVREGVSDTSEFSAAC